MRVNSINSNVSFGKVFALAGTFKQIERVGKKIKEYPGDVVMLKDATELYKGSNTDGFCSKAVRQGKELAFVITGKKDTDKVRFMEQGWGSMNGISHRLEAFLNITNVDKAARQIKYSMAEG